MLGDMTSDILEKPTVFEIEFPHAIFVFITEGICKGITAALNTIRKILTKFLF